MKRLLARNSWREDRLWKGYAVVASLLTGVYFLLGGHTGAQLAIYQLFILAAPVAILVGVHRHRPVRRLPWVFFSAGLALWCIGDAYWSYYRWVLHAQPPYPSPADVAFLGGYLFLIVGAFILIRGAGRPLLGDMLDTAIVALAAGTISTFFLLKPLLATPSSSFEKLIAIGFPVFDFVIVVALVQLLFRNRIKSFAVQAFLVGAGALIVADGIYSYLSLQGTYTSGMIIDLGWLICFSVWPIAALHPSMARIKSLPEQRRRTLSLGRIGALLAALLTGPAVLIVQVEGEKQVDTGKLAAIIIVTTVLVAIRVALLQREGTKTQSALNRADERLRLAHRVGGISTWEIDFATGNLVLSKELAAMIAGDADPVLDDWIAFIHPDDRKRITAGFTETRKRGGDFEHEYRFVARDGMEGWMFSRGRIIKEKGVAVRALGVGVEVTERHRIEEQLKQSEESFRRAEDAANVGTWDLNITTGELLWSSSMRRLIGVPPGFEPTYEAFLGWIHPDDRERVDQTMSDSLRYGTSLELQYRVLRLSDGAEAWMESRGRGVVDSEGRPVRSVGVALDITSRHVLQEELRGTSERMELSQKLSGIGTWETDLDTNESSWSTNLRRIYGVDDDIEATHENFMALIHPDDRASVEAAGQPDAADGLQEFEYRLIRPNDGEVRWLLSRGDFPAGSNGRRMLGVAVDITERRAAEEHQTKLEHQLRQAHKLEAVGRLAGGVAHDFNNILLAIRGNGELALDSLKQGENATEEVEEMIEAANRAAALTAQLLAYSRRQVLQAEVLDLNKIVQAMDSLLRRMIGADVELRAVVGHDAVLISADRSQIEQVLANLAVNARDAMPNGGLLTVEVGSVTIGPDHGVECPPGEYARLTVTDTGEGMDSETVANVFEPFFSTKEDGTGFGLSTVHGIVLQTGGSISVYSEVGHGTAFKIYLPLSEQAQALTSNEADSLASNTASTRETVLLVEDDPHVRRIVRNILDRSGYGVLTADGGEEALRLAKAEPGTIQMLLSDLVMPGMGGRELAEHVQELRPEIAVLYMSGYTDDAVIRRGVLEADMAFIQKPFGAEDLARRVRAVLDHQNERTEAV